jgi:hypothetical protein
MKVNLLVAPFRTINDIISHIPIVNRIAGRTLISIPVQISGNLDDPNIIPLAPSAVGEEIKGIMKGTLTLPFKIVEPIVSNQK